MKCCLCILLLFVFVSSPAAESGPVQSSITGIVTGPDGARIPGVTITARTGNEAAVQVVSNSHGMYRMPQLAPGRYFVSAELEGFETAVVSDLLVSEGSSRTLDLNLQLATVKQVLSVISYAPRDTVESTDTRESSARDVGEAVASEAGIWKIRKGAIANDIVVRGFQGKDMNVLIDGQRVYGACPNHMDPPAFHVDFSEVDRIEISKGPFDVKNQGSLGGVINVITRRAQRGLHAFGNLTAGSYDFINPSAGFSYGRERFSILGGYSYRSSSPYRDGNGRSFTDSVNYKPEAADGHAFKAGTMWTSFSLSPLPKHVAHVSFTRQLADRILYPYLQMDAVYDDTDRVNMGYRVDDISGVVQSLQLQVYFTRVDHWMTDQYRTSSAGMPRSYSMGTLAWTDTTGAKLETRLRGVLIGIEAFRRNWGAATEMAGRGYAPQHSIPDVRTDDMGIFFEYSKDLSERIRLQTGGRFDSVTSAADTALANTNLYFAYNSTRRTSATNNFPSGNVRLSYRIPSSLELAIGVGHTVRVPDARERYFALSRIGTDWVGNPSLKPSRNTGVEGKASFRRKSLLLEATLYYDHIADYITVVPQARVNPAPGVMNTGARSYQNVTGKMHGGEFLVSWVITRDIFFSTDFSYVKGRQDADPARNIPATDLAEIPPVRSRTSLRYETGRLMAEIEAVFAGAQRNVNTLLGEQHTAGYGTANLKAGMNLKGMVFRIGLNNLFDRAYHEHLSYQRDPFRSGARVFEPGRNVHVNLSYRF